MQKNKFLISLLINFGVSAFVFLTIFFSRFKIDHYIADSFSVTGVIMLGYAAIKFIASEGMFNILGFFAYKLVNTFKRNPQTNYKYYEYVEMKNGEAKPKLWPTLIVGAVYFIIGLILSLVIVL